jgi:hypothetical protein
VTILPATINIGDEILKMIVAMPMSMLCVPESKIGTNVGANTTTNIGTHNAEPRLKQIMPDWYHYWCYVGAVNANIGSQYRCLLLSKLLLMTTVPAMTPPTQP